MRNFFYILLLLGTFHSANAFEVVSDKKSFENNRLFSFNLGLGITKFSRSKGIADANPGFVFQTGLGHRFNRYLEGQFVYQLSTFRFNSPDPIDSTTQMQSRTGMHREFVLLKLFYPEVVAQPYISAGFGGYQFFGLNSETALAFPASVEIPFGAGVQTFISKNNISLDLDFTYHWMLMKNQDAATLSYLKQSSISSNMYTIIGGFTFHFL